MFGKRKIATLVAEFLGTGVLTLLILSVQRSTIGVPFFVATAAGLTLALMVFAFSGISNGFFNPALTIALFTVRRITAVTAVLYVVVQMLGAWGAYALYTYFVKNKLQPVGGHFTGRILVAEAVGSGVLSFGVAAAVYQRFSAAVTASFAGLSLMLGAIAASSASIGLLNPAVALGVRAWVWGTYVLGPVVGAVIGTNLYSYLFAVPEAIVVPATTSSAASTGPVVKSGTKATATKTASKKRAKRAKK